MTIRFMRIGHLQKDEDWLGNNAAFTCPQPGCGKVYIVSALIYKDGRECPACGRSKAFVSGSQKSKRRSADRVASPRRLNASMVESHKVLIAATEAKIAELALVSRNPPKGPEPPKIALRRSGAAKAQAGSESGLTCATCSRAC